MEKKTQTKSNSSIIYQSNKRKVVLCAKTFNFFLCFLNLVTIGKEGEVWVGWLVGWLVGWWVGCLFVSLFVSLSVRSFVCLFVCWHLFTTSIIIGCKFFKLGLRTLKEKKKNQNFFDQTQTQTQTHTSTETQKHTNTQTHKTHKTFNFSPSWSFLTPANTS